MLGGLLWLARSGVRWRDIPERYGTVPTLKMRYYRWLEAGIIDDIFQALVRGAGQEHDMKQAAPLGKECLPEGHVLADKAYDADSLINLICETRAQACIPPK